MDPCPTRVLDLPYQILRFPIKRGDFISHLTWNDDDDDDDDDDDEDAQISLLDTMNQSSQIEGFSLLFTSQNLIWPTARFGR